MYDVVLRFEFKRMSESGTVQYPLFLTYSWMTRTQSLIPLERRKVQLKVERGGVLPL